MLCACAKEPASTTPAVTDAPAMVASPSEPPTAVTETIQVKLDGTLGEGEWTEQSKVEDATAFRLHMMHSDALIIAVDAGQTYPHVCLFDGKSVRVLHASASLGTASYEREGDAWSRTEDFAWTARDADEPAVRASQRVENLQTQGWTGTTVGMGEPGHSELRIELDPDSIDATRVAVSVIASGGAQSWPTGVSDDCASLGLLMGNAPEQARFDTDAWAPLPKP